MDGRSSRCWRGRISRRRRRWTGRGAVDGADDCAGHDAGCGRGRSGRVDDLSVRRHRLAAGPARAAPAVERRARTSFDSVYVHIKEKNYEYQGYFAANTTPFLNLPIPEAVWTPRRSRTAVSRSSSRSSSRRAPTSSARTPRRGPSRRPTLQGTIYYNSYGTALVKNSDTNDNYGHQYGAGTLGDHVRGDGARARRRRRLARARAAPGCRVCHTVSADGKSLVTQASNANASDYSNTVYVNLANDTTGGAGTSLATRTSRSRRSTRTAACSSSSSGGMSDGDSREPPLLVPGGDARSPASRVCRPTSRRLCRRSRRTEARVVQLLGRLADRPDAGERSTATASRSPSSTSTAMSAFSNPRVLYTPAARQLGHVLVVLAEQRRRRLRDRARGRIAGWAFTWQSNTGELWWVDVASGMGHRLDQLNGYAGGNVYLPNNATGAQHAYVRAGRDAQLRADREPDRLGRLRLGRLHEPAHVRQRRAARPVAERSARLPLARRRSPTRSSGWPPSISTRRRAPTRATRRSTCRRRSSSRATRAATGSSIPATPTVSPARPATSAAAAIASRRRRWPRVLVDDAHVLGSVREVHEGQRLLRLPAGHHVHQRRV